MDWYWWVIGGLGLLVLGFVAGFFYVIFVLTSGMRR